MPDKLTDNEIMPIEKAKFILRHGSAEGEHKYFEAIDVIEKEINRLQAENEDLQDLMVKYNGDFAKQEAENERLNKEVDRLSQVVLYNDGVTEMKVEEAKAEAYKEFAERLKERPTADKDVQYVFELKIDNLLKELVGENNES